MKKILIVDDYPDILEGLSYILKNHYEVTTAGSLTEAKKEVSTTVFDNENAWRKRPVKSRGCGLKDSIVRQE